MFDIIMHTNVAGFNWNNIINTMFGTLFGAIFAFLLNAISSLRDKKEKQIGELILFIYDLNILLKLLMLLYVDIEDKLKDFAKGYRNKRAILFHNPILLDETPLHFVVKKIPSFMKHLFIQKMMLVLYGKQC